jgi:hypothetical protein
MRIEFVSTLTQEDEEQLALKLLNAAKVLLEDAAFNYMLRIETSAGRRFSHDKPPLLLQRTQLTA